MGPLEMLLIAFAVIFGPVGIAIACIGLIVAPALGVMWVVGRVASLVKGGE